MVLDEGDLHPLLACRPEERCVSYLRPGQTVLSPTTGLGVWPRHWVWGTLLYESGRGYGLGARVAGFGGDG